MVTKIFAKGSEIHKLQSFLSPTINVELQGQFNQRLHGYNIDCGERGTQVLEKWFGIAVLSLIVGLIFCQVQDHQQQTWPDKTPVTVFQRHYSLRDILQNADNKLKQLLSKIWNMPLSKIKNWKKLKRVFIHVYRKTVDFSPTFLTQNTAWNTVISHYFLAWKFCGKAQFSPSFGRITRNYTETVPFHKVPTPEN